MRALRATAAAIALLGIATAAPAQRSMIAAPMNLAVHGGVMMTPRGAALVGGDAALSSLSLLPGFQGRLDVDVITKANFGGINTVIPVTLSQVMHMPNPVGYTSTYYGVGVGAMLGGKTSFDGKLLLGADLNSRLGAEANLHFTEHQTILTVYARLKL